MATETENLKLSKAETSDEILQTLQANNENFDKIDEEITALNEKEFVLPIASNNILGGIKVGEGLSINEDGTLQVMPQSSGSGITVLEASTDNVIDFNTLTESGIYLIKNCTTTTTLNGVYSNSSYTCDTILQVRKTVSTTGDVYSIAHTAIVNVEFFYTRTYVGSSNAWGSWIYQKIPKITYSTTDLTAGTSTLATGDFYFVYE